MPGLKTLAVVVAVKGGARWEPENRSGWSHLLEHLVFKGAGDMAAREIVERIEAQGGTINAATGYERTSFEVRGLDGSLPLAMQVLSDLVFRPTLDPAEIEREKDVVAQEIAEAFDPPDDHVFEMVQTRAFRGQPLGRPILGSVASLKPAERASVEAWRARLYSPDRMVVAVSGAVDEAELLTLAERWFGDAAAMPADAPGPAAFVGGHTRLNRKIEQANLVFQLPALGATDPQLPALRLFAEILGGGMASRLFERVRIDVGPDRAHHQAVVVRRDVDEVQERVRHGGEVLGTGATGARPRARHHVGDTVDDLAALVVVIVARQHELYAVLLEQRRERAAGVDARALVPGRVGRVVHRDDGPGGVGCLERVLEVYRKHLRTAAVGIGDDLQYP